MKRLVLLLAFCACSNSPGPQQPEPSYGPYEDQAGPAQAKEWKDCELGCGRSRFLGCPEAAATPEGATCEEVCENTMDGPDELRWDTACMATQTSCGICH